MYPLKAPDPDGMPPLFFQKFWNVSGEVVTATILDFLNHGVSPPDFNKTHIIPIPKVKNSKKVTEYRPISLCNVVYKIASKSIANRLKKILPSIISDTQSAFVHSRLITDNVLIAFETMHHISQKKGGKVGEMALKLDMSKAYDRVEWRYLDKIMEKLEGLSSLIKASVASGALEGIAVCRRGPKLSHLFFADDSLIFCKASLAECDTLQQILKVYEQASGQQLNRTKTSLFFSRNTPHEIQEEIKQRFGAQVIKQHEKYLGLPSLVGKNKRSTFNEIKEKLHKKLAG
ncbi:uncharacterized protein LOC126700646 [Quercus robur]|uniref:uncharacterized protein LOC126700646 n=1 Tax=Quercus robur TaxID=38942 RepID=UPI0021639325|nr:uncharacterized protein LOC126700646 [Quercus robur]